MKSVNLKDMEPLTAEEKAFSSDLENYNQFFKYMKVRKLDQEEWYDILILHYLRAVKKYLNIPHLQQYEFGAVLFRTLDSARSNYCKSITTQKRMPDGGLVSLDYTIEDDRGREHQVEAWLIDRKSNVERQVIFKEMFQEFYAAVSNDIFSTVSDHDKWLLDLILDGYEMKEIIKKYEDRYGKCDPDDWWKTIDYINYALNGRIRTAFKKAFGI